MYTAVRTAQPLLMYLYVLAQLRYYEGVHSNTNGSIEGILYMLLNDSSWYSNRI